MASNAPESRPIHPGLYSDPPDIDGASIEELIEALHLLEFRHLIKALRKILGHIDQRITDLEAAATATAVKAKAFTKAKEH